MWLSPANILNTQHHSESKHDCAAKVLYLEHDLSEILLVKLSELSETELAEVWEEDSPLLLHLALHVHHLLLRGADAEGVERLQQVLRTIISGSFWT